MKKLMISTIILLPLLILAIMLVSGAIMSMVTHIYVEQVEFVDNGTITLIMDDEQTPPKRVLPVNILPLKAKNRDIMFSSADDGIVSVDESGTVTARFYGRTTVRVTSVENTAAYDELEVWVTDNHAHAIDVQEYTEQMYRGETQKFTAQILPQEANNKNVIWTSSDPDVLAVSAGGDAVCKGAGMVTVTATSEDNKELTDTATVYCHLPLENIELESKESAFVTALKTAQFPKVEVYPQADESYTTVYSSSDENIAHVDADGSITFFRAGKITATVTVSDARGHSFYRSIPFTCTDGYYTGPLFPSTTYSFDFDEQLDGENSAVLPITLQKSPDGSYRQIVDVNTDNSAITFDSRNEQFVLHASDTAPLQNPVKLTIHARKYNVGKEGIEDVTDVAYVTFARSARSLSFEMDGTAISEKTITDSSVNIREVTGNYAGIGCVVQPQNHTDKLVFQLIEGKDIATFEGNILTFSDEGYAVVRASIENSELSPVTVKVIHVLPSPEEKEVVIDSNTETVAPVSLKLYGEEKKDTAFMNIQTPEGKETRITTDRDDVVSIDEKTHRIAPLKGGFVIVTVTFVSAQSAGIALMSTDESISFTIYVDRPVEAKDISFDIENGYKTAKDFVDTVVTLNVSVDAMEGKELYFDGDKVDWIGGDTLTYSGRCNFAPGEQDKTLVVRVVYSDKAKEYVSDRERTVEATRSIHTSRGTLEGGSEIVITCDGNPLQTTTNEIVFEDIWSDVDARTKATKSIEVRIVTPEPSDFVFDRESIKKQITFADSDIYTVEVEYVSESDARVIITAIEGGEVADRPLNVASCIFSISVKTLLPAHNVTLTCDDSSVLEGVEYVTYMSELTLGVSLTRKDGRTPTACAYTLDGVEHNDNSKASFNLTVLPTADSSFSFTCGSATINFVIHSKKLSDCIFTYALGYTENSKFYSEEFLFDNATGNQMHKVFNSAVQDEFTISIVGESLPENLLGGFVKDDLKAAFKVACDPITFRSEFNEDVESIRMSEQYILLFTIHCVTKQYFNATLDFSFGGDVYSFVFDRSGLQAVSYGDGFNSTLSADIYRGYQQVRVFAKHSYYGKLVDYFAIPVTATEDVVSEDNDLAAITWTLTRRQWDRSGDEKAPVVVTEQRGIKVIYGGEEYKIIPQSDGPSTLVKVTYDESSSPVETTVAQGGKYVDGQPHVTWVDVYAEEGKAHIYFGDYGGLSEVDVRNDYFGDFGEIGEGWKITPDHENNYDKSDRDFAASENAWSFLRVNAGDGTDSGVNCHFNFNVLGDDTLVNVFDADGYYANNNIVLHEDLYGEGELGTGGDKYDNATKKGLFLTNPSGLGKTLLYGNGYQVNLQAKTASMGQYSESDGVTISNAYNTIIKCANPAEEINNKNQKMVLKMAYAYYCDLSYYYKFNPSSKTFYAKNTVFSCIPKAAVQLYYNDDVFYAENIVMTECGTSIQADNGSQQNIKIYYKGSIDILNYFNSSALSNLNPLISAMFQEVVPGIKEYFEWHGKDISATAQIGGNNVDNIYVNILAFAISNLGGKTFIWNDGEYKALSAGGGALSGGAKIASKNLVPAFGEYYYALTYEVLNGDGERLDNATVRLSNSTFTGAADLNSLFSTNRYIRLQCEFKDAGDKNYAHIKWHKENVYRDTSLIAGRKSHIDDLRESLKGTTWADGSGVDSNGDPFEPTVAAQVNAMISQTVIPGKHSYVD